MRSSVIRNRSITEKSDKILALVIGRHALDICASYSNIFGFKSRVLGFVGTNFRQSPELRDIDFWKTKLRFLNL